MNRPLRRPWQRTETQAFYADLGRELTDEATGATAALTGTPRVTLERLVEGTWTDRTSQVSLDLIAVVSAAVAPPKGSGLENAIVRWRVQGVALDADEPEPGSDWRWRIECDTSDGREAGTVVPLRITG